MAVFAVGVGETEAKSAAASKYQWRKRGTNVIESNQWRNVNEMKA